MELVTNTTFDQGPLFHAVLTDASEGMITSTLISETVASAVDGTMVQCRGESSADYILFTITVAGELLITIKI